jgi:hypothetical protein
MDAGDVGTAAPLGAMWMPDQEAWKPIDEMSNRGQFPPACWMVGWLFQVSCSTTRWLHAPKGFVWLCIRDVWLCIAGCAKVERLEGRWHVPV